jgi:predicted membrane protein
MLYKKIKTHRLAILLGLVIASPLLLEILLFWNNDSFGERLKSMEKSISLLLFPFILGNYKRVQFIKLLQFYSYTTTAIVLFFFIRFIVVYRT